MRSIARKGHRLHCLSMCLVAAAAITPVTGALSTCVHAIQLHAFGAADNLRFEEVDDPVPASGQVRIAVTAAGVHLIDTAIRAGRQMGPMPLPALPTIPGREIAGVVEALGPDVGNDWLGQRVVAHLGT